MEKKYYFTEIRHSEYPEDPLFKTKDFTLYGNPSLGDNDPYLFEIYNIKPKRFAYCLTQPRTILNNKDLLLKTRRYLLFHENNKDLYGPRNTYFIGDMQKSIDISSEFTDQNVILVTYEMIEQWYPKTLNDLFKLIIKSVYNEQKYLGQHNYFHQIPSDLLFITPGLNEEEKARYRLYLFKCLVDEGYVSLINDSVKPETFILTAKSIDFIQNANKPSNKQAFIAIKFDSNEDRINIIQKAISDAGFEPKIMNKYETNNWIMPEIFSQIKESRFVVVDFSIQCDGAYYEAGYAAALDKPVIHLFDKRAESETNKLHFDIAQKSTIFYKDFDDLKKRLIDRIKATIK